MNEAPSPLRAGIAMAGGAVLSFIGLGVLWIGTPWACQALMGVPFFLLTAALKKTDPLRRNWAPAAIAGAAPLGLVITIFRDSRDSHLTSILIVCAWAAGAWAGGRLFAKKAAG